MIAKLEQCEPLESYDLDQWEFTRSKFPVQAIHSTGPGTYTLQVRIQGNPYYVSMVDRGMFHGDMNVPVETPYVEAANIDDVIAWIETRLIVFARCRFVNLEGYIIEWELAGSRARGRYGN